MQMEHLHTVFKCSKTFGFWHAKMEHFHGAQNSERNFGIRWSKTNDYTKSPIRLHSTNLWFVPTCK